MRPASGALRSGRGAPAGWCPGRTPLSASTGRMAWDRRQTEAGLITVMIGPSVVSESARLLDPSAAWVLLPDHCPAVEHGWQEMALPLLADELLSPRRLVAVGVHGIHQV